MSDSEAEGGERGGLLLQAPGGGADADDSRYICGSRRSQRAVVASLLAAVAAQAVLLMLVGERVQQSARVQSAWAYDSAVAERPRSPQRHQGTASPRNCHPSRPNSPRQQLTPPLPLQVAERLVLLSDAARQAWTISTPPHTIAPSNCYARCALVERGLALLPIQSHRLTVVEPASLAPRRTAAPPPCAPSAAGTARPAPTSWSLRPSVGRADLT